MDVSLNSALRWWKLFSVRQKTLKTTLLMTRIQWKWNISIHTVNRLVVRQVIWPLENSVDDLELSTERKNSLLNSHDSVSSSLPSVSSGTSEDSALGGSLSDDVQKTLKRQGLTLQDLLQSAPPFAVKWKSVRDVFQCLTCAAPIDFLSRKVWLHSCI